MQNVIEKISILQKNAVRFMTFSQFKAHSEPLFKKLKILKVKDNIFLQNCLFVYDYFHGNLPKSFDNIFMKLEDLHTNNTRNAHIGMIAVPTYNSTRYGLNSVYKKCIDSWNTISNMLKELKDEDDNRVDLHKISRNKLKHLITENFLTSYLETP